MRPRRAGSRCTNDVGTEECAHLDYHLFREGELEDLVAWAVRDLAQGAAGDTKPAPLAVPQVASGWDKGNWWGIWRVEHA